MRQVAVGIDPGASGGVALVDVGEPRPRLLYAARLYGSSYTTWVSRADATLTEVAAAVDRAGVAVAEVPVWVEDPPPAIREGGLDGDSRGLASWVGLGRYQGFALAAAVRAGFSRFERVQVSAWTRVLGPAVASRKSGDGAHRIREAGMLLAGGEVLATLPVDVSESALVACAAALRKGELPPPRKGRRRR